ncbi:acylamino-acid-releasing enzyme-like [Antedon mediterranea]|uniref:acylamino-acid-releasing enzyme-like n=1 Tax=Antedon mediterranea TaxID=105859 RepID=UPI003AF7A007
MSVDRAVALYQEASRIPAIVSGSISCHSKSAQEKKSYTVTSCWSQRDLQRMESIKSLRQHQIITDAEGIATSCIGFPTESKGELLRRVSPSGKLTAVVRKLTNKNGEEKQYIDVWNSQQKILAVDVAAVEKTGKIYEDEQFGCLEWSASEKKLMFVAEKKQPKSSSYFGIKSSKDDEENDNDGKGNEYVYLEDWGEQLVSKHLPTLCVLDIESGAINVVEGVPDDISPGQALWAPNDRDIVFIGWANDPYRLGLRFCPIRSSKLYHLKVQEKTVETLSDGNQAVSNPRFNIDMSKLIYLRNCEGGPHMQCSQLFMYDWNTKETKTVVKIQDRPKKSEFPGLYLTTLPRRCWASDNKRIYTHSIWRSCREIVEINIETEVVRKVTSFGSSKIGTEWSKYSAWTVLDVSDDLILAACAAPNLPQRLVIGKLFPGGDIKWNYLDEEHLTLSDFKFEIKNYTPKEKDSFDFEAILLTPENDTSERKLPLIALPHGGPHSTLVADYMLYPSTFCRLGFAVLLINYRGSLGFGNDFILSLPGNVGCNDVKDCKQAIDQTIQDGIADGDNVVLQGGSHGGFLVCHLIGQYPNDFKACVARNPVTNMASKLGATDIPDWGYTESGLSFSHSRLPSSEVYAAMFEKSPLFHVDKVKTPTMIMIGNADKRVPPQQGYEYAKALKAREVEVRVLTYPDDNHSLAKTNYEADAFINMFKWFVDHL